MHKGLPTTQYIQFKHSDTSSFSKVDRGNAWCTLIIYAPEEFEIVYEAMFTDNDLKWLYDPQASHMNNKKHKQFILKNMPQVLKSFKDKLDMKNSNSNPRELNDSLFIDDFINRHKEEYMRLNPDCIKSKEKPIEKTDAIDNLAITIETPKQAETKPKQVEVENQEEFDICSLLVTNELKACMAPKPLKRRKKHEIPKLELEDIEPQIEISCEQSELSVRMES